MNIREHPLSWRWTEPAYAVLPESTLARMDAVGIPEARVLHERSMLLLEPGGLSTALFPIVMRHSADVPGDCGTLWLRTHQPDLATRVFISWQEDTALVTTWDVFATYWNHFCYPSSDDVVVWPESEQWALLYLHYEEFQFGSKPRGWQERVG